MSNSSLTSLEGVRLTGKMAGYYNPANPTDPVAPLSYLRGVGWMVDKQTGSLRSPFGMKGQQEQDSLHFLAQVHGYSYAGTQ